MPRESWQRSARTIVPADERTLGELPGPTLARMRAAGEEVRECQRVLARADLNLVGECLRGQGTFFEFDHYPAGEVHDRDTRAQYYYHSHRGLPDEHGHFHTFVRAGVAPRGESPAADGGERLAHLVALSMDREGEMLGLFSTNRWVTGEDWHAAPDVIGLLDRFRIDHAFPSWPLNRWLSAVLVLFRPEVEQLLHERDRALDDWRAVHPGGDALEERTLEVLSEVRICIDTRIAALR